MAGECSGVITQWLQYDLIFKHLQVKAAGMLFGNMERWGKEVCSAILKWVIDAQSASCLNVGYFVPMRSSYLLTTKSGFPEVIRTVNDPSVGVARTNSCGCSSPFRSAVAQGTTRPSPGLCFLTGKTPAYSCNKPEREM